MLHSHKISLSSFSDPSVFVRNIIVSNRVLQLDFYLEALREEMPWYMRPEAITTKIFVGLFKSPSLLEKSLRNPNLLRLIIKSKKTNPHVEKYFMG